MAPGTSDRSLGPAIPSAPARARTMIPAITAAFVAGLIGSPHCIGMCGSFALACGGRVSQTAAWHGGKTLTYASLGALAGLLGDAVPGPSWIATVLSAALVVWFAAGLAGLTPEPTLRIPGLTRLATRAAMRGDLGSRFVFGMATGLLPCGLVYATLGISVASGTPWSAPRPWRSFGAGHHAGAGRLRSRPAPPGRRAPVDPEGPGRLRPRRRPVGGRSAPGDEAGDGTRTCKRHHVPSRFRIGSSTTRPLNRPLGAAFAGHSLALGLRGGRRA